MQRKAIRATVGATDVDIPIHTFLTNQCLVYAGGAITTEVRVRFVGTPTAGNLASWFNQETIQDSGILAADIVHNPGTSVTRQIAVFSDTTGKAIAAAPVQVDTLGAMTLVTNINGRAVDSFVTGPNSATSSNVVKFNGTTGRAVIDSGVPIDSVVQSFITPTINQVAVFTGTGIAIKNATVTINGGAIAGVTTINGTTIGDFVTGPASATSGAIATYNGTTGKVIQNTAVTISGTTISGATVIAGKTISSLVNANTGSVNLNLTQYSGTTGQLIQDSGIAAANVVQYNTGAGSPILNELAGWDTTSSPYKASWRPVRIDTSGNMTLVTTINSRNPDTFVAGPSSSINNNLPVFNGTGGKTIADSGINLTDVPLCSVAGSANTVATFTGSGKTIQGTTVSIVSGNITAGTYNGVTVAAHADRHASGGADPMYTSGFQFGDSPYNDAVDNPLMAPRYSLANVMSSVSVSSSAIDLPGSFIILPSRSGGHYIVRWTFALQFGDTSGNIEVIVVWSSGTGRAIITMDQMGTLVATVSNATASFPMTATTPSVTSVDIALGLNSTSGSCNIKVRLRKSSGVGYSAITNGTAFVYESQHDS